MAEKAVGMAGATHSVPRRLSEKSLRKVRDARPGERPAIAADLLANKNLGHEFALGKSREPKKIGSAHGHCGGRRSKKAAMPSSAASVVIAVAANTAPVASRSGRLSPKVSYSKRLASCIA